MTEIRYICNAGGKRQYAIIPIKDYEALLRLAEDAEDIAL